MKTKIIYSLILFVFAFAACEKTDNANKQDDKALENVLTLNEKYQKIKNQTRDFHSVDAFKKVHAKSLKDGSDDDTTSIWEDWETCATIKETLNDDGSYTSIIDYGTEGCEDYGTLIKGKITLIWKITGTGFNFQEIFENFYMDSVTIDGKTVYESTYAMESWDNFVWSGTEDLKFTFDDGEVVDMTGTYKEKSSTEAYTVLEGNYAYTSSKGYSFNYEVTKPLVYSYICEDTYIPVEGTEKINYTEGGVNEEFVMDYGNGTCDNKYTITNNGLTEEYDYDVEDWFSDGGNDWNDSDSTNVSG